MANKKESFTDEYDMDIKKTISNKKDIIDLARSMEDDDYVTSSGMTSSSFLPSSMLKNDKPTKSKEETDYEDISKADAWFNELMGIGSEKVSKKGRRKGEDIFSFDYNSKKKKKKKKKDKDGNVDYKKEFEPEMALYKDLLVEQSRFTDALQKEYDKITSVKGSSRGVTKQLTDLMDNITKARALSAQLVDKTVSTKKIISDLTIKQKKELSLSDMEGASMSDFASTYLKQMLSSRGEMMNNDFKDGSIVEYDDEEDLFSDLETSLGDTGRSDAVEKFLQYENSNVTVYVNIIDKDVDNYQFIAKDENGNVIEDYPLPNRTSLSINRSTNLATDIYGQKYQIIWS